MYFQHLVLAALVDSSIPGGTYAVNMPVCTYVDEDESTSASLPSLVPRRMIAWYTVPDILLGLGTGVVCILRLRTVCCQYTLV